MNEKTEKKSLSIHPIPRSRKKQLARSARRAKNRVARADVNREHTANSKGSGWNKNPGAYHSAIVGLSLGVGAA